MSDVLAKVRKSLGRTATPTDIPPPPSIDDSTARLVGIHATELPELFARRAAEMKMAVAFARPSEIAEDVGDFLREHACQKIMVSAGGLLERLGIAALLVNQGFVVRKWTDVSLDQSYDFDAAVTDADYAVAETGTLVIRPTANHGRALTLVPMYHVAIIEPSQILPDLVDAFTKLATEKSRSNVCMISGPSKTADIEMNTVVGVHGPNIVKTFILR